MSTLLPTEAKELLRDDGFDDFDDGSDGFDDPVGCSFNCLLCSSSNSLLCFCLGDSLEKVPLVLTKVCSV